ncbi:hypothetical protein DWV00_27300 [Trinickia dinghuensis]|uniref:Uncharacterized protein n=1 Tax=Trinickia dinghuensis TaxID=2291023 RepID=A0A3D8JSC1_9BURK|nr:hypothetical protein DWV00_27300 [Trinickia dinghuensis]
MLPEEGARCQGQKGLDDHIPASFVDTACSIKHSRKVDRLTRFKIAGAKGRELKLTRMGACL